LEEGTVDRIMRGYTRFVTPIASAVALLFSGFSLYETAIRRPDLRAFVPPVVRYASPYNNSNFEVFEVPVTIANLGARSGTVLAMNLEVTNPRTKEVKRFFASDLGRWTMDNARALAFKPFAPISLQGKSSTSESVLFYTRTDEKVQQIVEQAGGRYQFRLSLDMASPDDLGWLDQLFGSLPAPVTFEVDSPELDHRVFTSGTLQMRAPGT
jgi:hypothetical protein